jgi:hypothetical protein
MFWSGMGVLETRTEGLVDRIVSPGIWSEIENLPHISLDSDLIPLHNFSSVKVFPEKFGVGKELSEIQKVLGGGSCKIGIGGTDERAIELISLHLGGNHENTDHYYKDKSVDKILDTYNPPSIRPDYKKLVKGVMLKISSEPIVS